MLDYKGDWFYQGQRFRSNDHATNQKQEKILRVNSFLLIGLCKMIPIIITITLAVLHLQNSAFGLPTPGSGSGPCNNRNSCALPRNEDEDHLWGNYTCECGPHCVQHDTCCQDSPHAGTVTPHDGERPRETCQSMAPHFLEHVALVSSCSDRWQNEQGVRDLCEERDTSQTRVPVTSTDTGLTYRNLFCATCNFDGRVVHPWHLVLIRFMGISRFYDWNMDAPHGFEHDILDDIEYEMNSGSFPLLKHPDGLPATRYFFIVPINLRKVVKKCHPHIVSDCDASYASDDGLRSKCLSYYSPVDVESDGVIKKYRNVHCAICNGEKIEEDSTC